MFIVLWALMILESASAAPAEEIQALKAVGEALGTNIWNLTTDPDPCSGKWQGINCCELSQLNSPCCTKIFVPGPVVCSLSSINSTIVGVNLNSNYNHGRVFTGFLSDSICNLTSLVTLDLSNNFIIGQIPTCIGTRLTRLKRLGLSGGNKIGGFPKELGNLNSLEELSLENNNLTGQIPSSIGGMTSLRKLNIRNNLLEGELPAEIGKLTNLVEIRFQVNRLSGTLAPLATLTNLTHLKGFKNRFSGELSIFQDLGIFQGLLKLERVDFHLNNFTGSVPAFDERFTKLSSVDFSFNQLSGSIPESLGELPALEYLSLGHNNLSGGVPYSDQSFKSLKALDISHNLLTGPLSIPFPKELSADFSFNSLSLNSTASNKDLEQSYFNCVSIDMRNISASCDPPRRRKQSLFAVLAGSTSEFKTREGITFQKDAAPNEIGLHYLNEEGSWSVEVVGESSGTLPARTKIQVSPENQDDPALYRTMRWSSSYLAYHGTDLENGGYNVTLYFCETAFQNATFRAFDVKIQGETIARQLDVAKLVGLNNGYRITKNTTVTNGRLSIEFINTGYDRYLDNSLFRVNSTAAMVSAVLVKSFNYVSPSSRSSKSTWWEPALIASAVVSFLAILCVLLIIRRRRRDMSWARAGHFDLKAFKYKELFNATDGFNPKNMLGEGGFGSVYMGRFQDKLVAVKQLLHQTQQGRESLRKEIEILSRVQHRNLVPIRGYCLEAEHPMLVFDYMQKGSLDGFLHGNSGLLTWKQRYRIAVDTAFGLAYLHDESTHRIIHCDMKPPNILLTDELHPRIADFGMARFYEEGRSHITATRMGGTIGYVAPEYVMHYQLSDKADVYSFGVVLLELISGRRAVDSSKSFDQVVLVEYALRLAMEAELVCLVDKKIEAECEAQEVVDAGKIAVLCTLENPSLRPRMREVWLMLKGTMEIPEIPVIADTKLTMVRTLLSVYEKPFSSYEPPSSVANSQGLLIQLSPR